MPSLRLLLIGYGRMGRMVERVALQRGHSIVAIKSDRSEPPDVWLQKFGPADVVIEFTSPDSAFDNIAACFRVGIPVVSGTTGWHKRLSEAEALCRAHQGTMIVSSNFSLGVHLFFELNRWLARRMIKFPEYRPVILESHHTGKKDMPSGTAVQLAQDLIQISGQKGWQLNSAEQEDLLSLFSSRVPGEVGRHQVVWTSPVDRLEIRHHAFSREGFALGAVMAAEFLAGRQGMYSMRDVLGFTEDSSE